MARMMLSCSTVSTDHMEDLDLRTATGLRKCNLAGISCTSEQRGWAPSAVFWLFYAKRAHIVYIVYHHGYSFTTLPFKSNKLSP